MSEDLKTTRGRLLSSLGRLREHRAEEIETIKALGEFYNLPENFYNRERLTTDVLIDLCALILEGNNDKSER